ncbi:NUDIX domain-containing protein [Lysinibacillus antri]|uniref:NUDIX domain-containing protein n=1 Tax=Lysinibacillus antri TaxID=2498145 RepID=A0A432LA80_9BACI|nr:NUDIX domain-containing protein [Lysinibacillus antri]RUL50348.1 NUDIX domain-containing protein [Lysinibacillus antri]
MKEIFHHIVRGVLIEDNKVLLVQSKGYLNTFLPGGQIELGESAKDALGREFEEELGITCTVGDFLGVVEHKWAHNGVIHFEVNQVFEIKESELQKDVKPISAESHLEFSWCNVNELSDKNLQPYPFRELIKNHLNGSKDIWWESTLKTDESSFE